MELNSFVPRRLGVSLVTRGISNKQDFLPPRDMGMWLWHPGEVEGSAVGAGAQLSEVPVKPAAPEDAGSGQLAGGLPTRR